MSAAITVTSTRRTVHFDIRGVAPIMDAFEQGEILPTCATVVVEPPAGAEPEWFVDTTVEGYRVTATGARDRRHSYRRNVSMATIAGKKLHALLALRAGDTMPEDDPHRAALTVYADELTAQANAQAVRNRAGATVESGN